MDAGNARTGVENETVVALAEVMDIYLCVCHRNSVEWEKEFQPARVRSFKKYHHTWLTSVSDILSLVLILASESFPLVAEQKWKALPFLTTLARLLTTTICSTFEFGTFLSSVSASVTLSPQHQVHISVCPSDNLTTNKANTIIC